MIKITIVNNDNQKETKITIVNNDNQKETVKICQHIIKLTNIFIITKNKQIHIYKAYFEFLSKICFKYLFIK